MNIYFRCLESRIDKNNTLYGKFNLTSIPSGQGNTFANALRRSLFSDLSGLAITHFCITSAPGLGYEFATIPGLAESLLDFSLNLKKVVLTGRLTGTPSTCYKSSVPLDHLQQKSKESEAKKCKSSLSLSPKSTPLFNPPISSPISLARTRCLNTLGCTNARVRLPFHSMGDAGTHASSHSFVARTQRVQVHVKKKGQHVAEGELPNIFDVRGKEKGNALLARDTFTPKEESYRRVQVNAKKVQSIESETKRSILSLKKNKKYNVQNLPSLAPIGFLKAKGPAILRACDLILPPGIRCVHPDQYLGTLAADSALSVKFLIAAGKGYIVQDETFYISLSRAKLLLSSRNGKNPIFSTSPSVNLITRRAKASGSLSATPNKNFFSASLSKSVGVHKKNEVKKKYISCINSLPCRSCVPLARTRCFTSSLRVQATYIDARLQLPLCLATSESEAKSHLRHQGKEKAKLKATSLNPSGDGHLFRLWGRTSKDSKVKADTGKKDNGVRTLVTFNDSNESKAHNAAQNSNHIKEPLGVIFQGIKNSRRSFENACRGTLFQKSINQEQSLSLVNDNEKLSRKQLIWDTEDKFHPVLPLDATFTPISKVNFQIDIDRNTEKSEETIVLEIWTNGSITPKRAIQESCLALAQDFYSLFSSVNGFSNLHLWWKRESLQFYPKHFS